MKLAKLKYLDSMLFGKLLAGVCDAAYLGVLFIFFYGLDEPKRADMRKMVAVSFCGSANRFW